MPYAAFHDDCETLSKPTLEDLRSVAADGTPQGLLILDYPWDSLEPLALFPDLGILKIQSAGTLHTLSGVEALARLRTLFVSPPPSWDGSRRCIEVDSYRPLRSLAHLERLTLLSVGPRDLDLAPIAEMRRLRDRHVAGVPEFGLEHYARLAAALPETSGRCLQPYTRIEGIGFCKRCQGRTVLLTGAPPRSRRWLCP